MTSIATVSRWIEKKEKPAPEENEKGPPTPGFTTCDGCGEADLTVCTYRCTICPDYNVCQWCRDNLIETKPHASAHKLEENRDQDTEPQKRRKKKVVPILSTCPACPQHILHVSAECPLERIDPPRELVQDGVPKYLPPHMRPVSEDKSGETTPLNRTSYANNVENERKHEKPVVPQPRSGKSNFYTQFDVCPHPPRT